MGIEFIAAMRLYIYPALGSADKEQKRKLKEKTDSKYSFSLAWLTEENREEKKMYRK